MKKLFGIITLMLVISISLFAQSNINISKEVRNLPVCLYENGLDAGAETIESYFLDKEFVNFKNQDGSEDVYSYGNCTSDDTSCFIEIVTKNFVTNLESIMLFNLYIYDGIAWLEDISLWQDDCMVALIKEPGDKMLMLWAMLGIMKD